MTAAAQKQTEYEKAAETARAVAVACLQEADGDVETAVAALVRRVEGSERLFREIMTPLVRTACAEMIGLLVRTERRKVWRGEVVAGQAPKPHPSTPSARDKVIALASATLRGHMAFALPGGKLLANATKSDVEAAAHSYLTQGRDMTHKGRWLSMIAARVPENELVGRVLTEADLLKIKQEAGDE